MRRKNSKPKRNSLNQSQNISQLQLSQYQQQITNDEAHKQNVKQKRKQKKNQYVSTSNDRFQAQDQQVLDIKVGDQFVRQHIRPNFLKKWDGQSNKLQINDQQLTGISPMMKIYWKIKANYMNCIIFVQLGKSEFLAFENDAIKLHEIFKKPLNKFSIFLMVNFWNKQIELAKIQLFQRKIPILFLNEIQDAKYKEMYGIFKRQITQIITPSVFLNYESKQFCERIMLAIYYTKAKCGVVCIDIDSNHFYIEQFDQKEGEDTNLHHIRRIINKYRPAQVILQHKDSKIKKMAKQICQPYVIQIAPLPISVLQNLHKMNDLCEDQIFKRLIAMYKAENKQKEQDEIQFSFEPIVKALSMALHYMLNFKLEAKIFGQGIFQFEDVQNAKLRPMFDAQVYQNLQVFSLRDEPNSFGQIGTLYHYLNKCSTTSGQKLLKKWIDNPLRSKKEIVQRQQAIQSLIKKEQELQQLQQQLMKFEKLQKKVGDIYHWAVTKQQQDKIILTKDLTFDKDYDQNKNPAVARLKQINEVLNVFKRVQHFFTNFSQYQFDSTLLQKICKIKQSGDLYKISANQLQKIKALPKIENLINQIQNKVNYDHSTKQIYPKLGLMQKFDHQKQIIRKIQQQLNQQLNYWKKQLNVSKASYVAVRAKKQIEIPLNEAKSKKYKQLIFSSQTSKSIRYVTAKTTELGEQLIDHEQKLARLYEPFCSMMVKQFCSHKLIWQLYLSAIANLDVLISFAQVSKQMTPKTLPIFNKNMIHIQKAFHPALLQVKGKQRIIGNNLALKNQQRVLLLTGPNMGGKSTLLRQTCLLAIIAQLGCYVPCQHYESIIYDQIFCRIGASDRILQGKSTFYVELEETKRIIDQATPQSLVIIDQLGRGTSTYDGMSLASAILEYIIDQIQCYTLFSTHYFPIAEQYKSNKKVLFQKIGYYFQNKKIKFTYQLENGVAQKSFANQVAAYVGLSKQIINLASVKAKYLQNKQKDNQKKRHIQIKQTKSQAHKNKKMRMQFKQLYDDMFQQAS